MKIKQGCLAEIYTTSDESFSVGILLYEMKEYVVFHILDEQGRWDGFYLIKKSCISSIQYDTEYLQKIRLYMEYWKNHSFAKDATRDSILNTNPALPQILNAVYDREEIVTIATSDDPSTLFTGYIRERLNGNILLECIDMETAKSYENVEVAEKNIVFLEIESPDNELLKYANKQID